MSTTVSVGDDRLPRLTGVSAEPIDPGVIESARRVFDLARGGSTATAELVDLPAMTELLPGHP